MSQETNRHRWVVGGSTSGSFHRPMALRGWGGSPSRSRRTRWSRWRSPDRSEDRWLESLDPGRSRHLLLRLGIVRQMKLRKKMYFESVSITVFTACWCSKLTKVAFNWQVLKLWKVYCTLTFIQDLEATVWAAVVSGEKHVQVVAAAE